MKITKQNCWYGIEILIGVYLVVSSCMSPKTSQENNYARAIVENVVRK
jgi:hypothetical protein